MTPYLRRVEKGVQPCAEVVIRLFNPFNNGKAEVLVQLILDQRPGVWKGANAVIEDDLRFGSRRLDLAKLAIVFEQDLDAFEVAPDRSDFAGVELSVATFDLVGPDRLIGIVECDHVDLKLPNPFAVGQRALPASVQLLRAG